MAYSTLPFALPLPPTWLHLELISARHSKSLSSAAFELRIDGMQLTALKEIEPAAGRSGDSGASPFPMVLLCVRGC